MPGLPPPCSRARAGVAEAAVAARERDELEVFAAHWALDSCSLGWLQRLPMKARLVAKSNFWPTEQTRDVNKLFIAYAPSLCSFSVPEPPRLSVGAYPTSWKEEAAYPTGREEGSSCWRSPTTALNARRVSTGRRGERCGCTRTRVSK